MVRVNEKSIDDFLAKAQDTLQNSLVETGHSFTYQTGVLNYTLPGFAVNNERIFSIVNIEGVGFLPEDYLTEDDLIEGVDFSLFDNYSSPEIVPDGYGSAAGIQVFSGITIADQTFQDNSIVHLKFKYQNLNFVPILTNFSQNSVLRMILTATLLNIQETNEELVQSIDSFGLLSSGDNLDRLSTLVGLERTTAQFTTGQVKVINNDTVDNFTITTSHRFAAVAGGLFLAFAPLTSGSVPKDGGEVFFDVIADNSGSLYNVGSNSISIGFTNIALTNRVPTTIIISNPTLGDLGQQNLFNGGTDSEIDEDFRKRVSLAFSQTKTASYSTIEQAALSTNLIDFANVFDISLKKDLGLNVVQVFVSNESGVRLSSSSLTLILDAVNFIKPTGSRPAIRQTLNTFINFNFNIFVNQNTIGDTSILESDLNSLIDNFINTKGIGEDILPSSVVSLIKAVSEVVDIEINSHTITEFTSEAPNYDTQIDLSTAGVADNWVALQVPFNSATFLHNEVESGMSGTLNLDSGAHSAPNDLPVPVDDRTSPRVNIGVTSFDGVVRSSPLDRTDYHLGGNRNTITYDPLTAGGDEINTTDLVLFNYNYFDNMLIDGFRVRLGGDAGNVVRIDFGFGSNPNTIPANFISLITEVDVTLDGTERLYDFPLSSQLNTDNNPTSSPDADNFWLIVKYQSGSGSSHIPIDSTQSTLAFSPILFEDSDANGETFETSSQKRANWHSFTTFSDANAYKKIAIPSQTDEPEKPISFTHTYNFSLFEEK